MGFENANLGWKRILGPLKVRSAPVDEWILYTMNVETLDYNTEACVGEEISNGIRRHQNVKCFNCGRIGHLRRNCGQGIPRDDVSSMNGKNSHSRSCSGICRRYGKDQHWTNECRLTKDR